MEYITGNNPISFNNKKDKPARLGVGYIPELISASIFFFFLNVELKAQCPVTATMSQSATSVCQNAASPNIIFTGADGTAPYVFSYKLNNGAEQTISSVSGDIASLPVATGVTGTNTYEFTKVTDATNCSRSESGFVSVTVNPLPVANISGTATVCQNASSTNIVFTGTNSSPPYTFTYTINGGVNQTISTVSGNSVNLPVATGTTGTFLYSLVSVSDASNCSQLQTGSATITVTNPTINLSSAAGTDGQVVCLGSSINPITYAIGSGATGASLSGSLPSGVTGTYAGGVFTINGIPAVAGTFNYTISTTGSCNNVSLAGSIKVNNITPGAIATNQTICSGGDPAIFTSTTAAAGAGTITYQWQSSTIDCTNGFGNITGATSATYDAPAGVTVTTFYRRVATSTLNGVACSSNSNCITVTIHNLNPGTIGADQTICSGSIPAAFTVVAAATSTGTITYQWQKGTTGCTGTFTNITGATAATYAETSGITITTYYRRIATSTVSGVTCSLNSNCVTVTVNNVTAGALAGSQTICTGSNAIPLTVVTDATGSGSLTYQWQSNTTGCGNAFNNIAGATSATYTVPAGLAITTYFRRVVTSTLNGAVCTANSNCLTVTFNNITPGTIAGNQTICNGGNSTVFTSSTAATGTGTITYQWQSSTVDCNNGFSDISGANSSTYDAPAGLTVTTYYHRKAISTLNGVSCSSNGNCITVTIHDLTAGSIGTDQTICNSGDPAAFTSITAATSSGTVSYQWQSGTNGCSGPFNNIPGATTAVYNPPAGLTGTTYYRRVATSTFNGVTCSLSSNCVTVTVNNVTAGTLAGSTTLCLGNTTDLAESVAATGTGTLSYQWQSNTTGCGGTYSNISGATSSAYTVPAGLTVTTYFRRVVTSTINGVVCAVSGNCLTITPNTVGSAGVVAGGGQTICSGGNPSAFTSTSAATGLGGDKLSMAE